MIRRLLADPAADDRWVTIYCPQRGGWFPPPQPLNAPPRTPEGADRPIPARRPHP